MKLSFTGSIIIPLLLGILIGGMSGLWLAESLGIGRYSKAATKVENDRAVRMVFGGAIAGAAIGVALGQLAYWKKRKTTFS